MDLSTTIFIFSEIFVGYNFEAYESLVHSIVQPHLLAWFLHSSAITRGQLCFAFSKNVHSIPDAVNPYFVNRQIRLSISRKKKAIATFCRSNGSLRFNTSINKTTPEHLPRLSHNGGVRGIWTLARLLTAYSLSRGAPSASWVSLRIKVCSLDCPDILAYSGRNVKRYFCKVFKFENPWLFCLRML